VESAKPRGIPAQTELGSVHLSVTKAEPALEFYRDVLKLTPLASTGDSIRLGTPDGRELVVLHPGAVRPFPKGRSGLYHLALAVPNIKELARFEARLSTIGYEHYPTDHVISKSIYLWDGDGNGIEVYKETPEDGTFTYIGGEPIVRDRRGMQRSGRDPIDLRWLLGHLESRDDPDSVTPDGTNMGHVHLHVSDLDDSMRFYSEVLGFEKLMFSKSMGMSDVTSNDYRPHRIAFNVWAGQGASPAPVGSSGLRHFTIALPTAEDVKALGTRFKREDTRFSEESDALLVNDPSQNIIRIQVRGRKLD
jgi:catechol 2,3-dioxygenase